MRRKDRELSDRRAIDQVIRDSAVCHLALWDGAAPYVVPLSFGYDGDHLYFHSAREGRKLDLLRRHPRVGFAFTPAPELVRGKRACRWGLAYRSVVGTGRADLLEDREAKRRALAVLMAQYDDGAHTFDDAEVDRVAVIRVAIDELTGKATSAA